MKRYFLLAIVGFIASLATSSVGGASSVYASCGVDTGSKHSYAGAIIEMKWVNDAGQTVDANNTQAVVRTSGSTSTQGGNLVRLQGTSNVVERRYSATFNQYASGCGDGTNAVLGYGQTSSTNDGASGPWAIDCDISLHASFYQEMTFSGTGTPTGARAGGTWSVETRNPPNGYTTNVTVVYTQPGKTPGPSTWDAAGNSKVNGKQSTSANPGDTVTFTHFLNNVGGQNYSGLFWSVKNSSGKQLASGMSPQVTPGANVQVNSNTYKIPPGTPNGTKICQSITHRDSAKSTANETSTPACVTVGGPADGDGDTPTEGTDSLSHDCKGTCGMTLPNTSVGWAGDYSVAKPGNTSSITSTSRRYKKTRDVLVNIYATPTRGGEFLLSSRTDWKGNFDHSMYTLIEDIGDRRCLSIRLQATLTFVTTGEDYVVIGYTQATETTPSYPIYGWVAIQPIIETSTVNMSSPDKCYDVGNRARMQVWGGALRVGGNVTLGWTSASTGGAMTGDWSEYAGLIGGNISTNSATGIKGTEYATATRRDMTNDINKLLFANSGTRGNFGEPRGDTGSLINQFKTIASRNGFPGVNGSANGGYIVSGDLNIGGGNIARGQSIILYVTGTVTISGNISGPGGNYGSASDIGQLVIVAGAINIQSNVSQIDAWLLSTGTLNTCGDAPGNLTLNTCTNRLQINGPVYAEQIKLKRTNGARNVNDGDPAEIFNYRPDAAMWLRNFTSDGGKVQTKTVRELPPRF